MKDEFIRQDGQINVKYAGIITAVKKKYHKKQYSNGICNSRRFIWYL